jgi:putative DNA-invertase from lambdoid prophage Rac
MVVPVEV